MKIRQIYNKDLGYVSYVSLKGVGFEKDRWESYSFDWLEEKFWIWYINKYLNVKVRPSYLQLLKSDFENKFKSKMK